MKRVFGGIEAIFDMLYLASALVLGFILLFSASGNSVRGLAGFMALVLAGGDAFHLLPRIRLIFSGDEDRLRKALGNGKFITSITMTIFYVLLWRIGMLVFQPENISFYSAVVYVLAAARIALCVLPQNRWHDRYPPVNWGILRNIPFFLLGIIAAGLFLAHRNAVQGLNLIWLAIILSFIFYIPVVIWANRYPKIGMLMLPKSCAYLWLLAMCLSL
jgi:hypothetical protein